MSQIDLSQKRNEWETQGTHGTPALFLFLGLLLLLAVLAVNTPASSNSTHLNHTVQSAASYVTLASQDAAQAGIPPNLFVRQINQESGFDPNATGRAGEEGIAQFMPATAAELGINPWNPVQALEAAAHIMADYAHHYGSYAEALAAYNCGSGCLDGARTRCGNAWMQCIPVSTQAYIRSIIEAGA
jgi:soluble lytic murein transglycosylase-like protein